MTSEKRPSNWQVFGAAGEEATNASGQNCASKWQSLREASEGCEASHSGQFCQIHGQNMLSNFRSCSYIFQKQHYLYNHIQFEYLAPICAFTCNLELYVRKKKKTVYVARLNVFCLKRLVTCKCANWSKIIKLNMII